MQVLQPTLWDTKAAVFFCSHVFRYWTGLAKQKQKKEKQNKPEILNWLEFD